ncbi:MAG: Transferase hexapeptide [Rhodospirillaceae bacterium]|nr:MAG: Transferase hexapeptide [Rhodospirillaceae bacterium]TNC96684.1 MAG: Transferase hexapeptide repeat [Stygiobacter sp.]
MSGAPCFVIAGAGGLGREVAVYALDAGLRVRGFLDDTDADPRRFGLDIPVLSPLDSYVPIAHDVVLVAVGDPGDRAVIAARLGVRGADFGQLIHPLAYVARPAALGPGSIVAPFATIGLNARLGPHCLINTHAGIGHDAELGAACVISPHAVVNGFARLGDGVMMGSSAVVAPRVMVGAGATLSAGAVVLAEVAAGATVWGNPARSLPPAPSGTRPVSAKAETGLDFKSGP